MVQTFTTSFRNTSNAVQMRHSEVWQATYLTVSISIKNTCDLRLLCTTARRLGSFYVADFKAEFPLVGEVCEKLLVVWRLICIGRCFVGMSVLQSISSDGPVEGRRETPIGPYTLKTGIPLAGVLEAARLLVGGAHQLQQQLAVVPRRVILATNQLPLDGP